MKHVYVNSIFASVQGEGLYAGMPAIFLRMQGCKVNCPFCDTQQSWGTAPQYEMTINKVVDEVRNHNKLMGHLPLLVITGGEPLEQQPAVEQIACELRTSFPKIQIETSGYVPIGNTPIHKWAEICLSPKRKMAPVLQWYSIAESVKLLVGKDGLESPVDIEWLLETFPQLNSETVFLQPIDYTGQYNHVNLNQQAINNTLNLAMKHHVRVCLQMHKILGIR